MKNQQYLIRVSVSDIEKKQVWDPKKSMRLGYRLPWKIERLDGVIYLRHNEGKAWEVSEDVIEKRQEIELPPVKGEDLKVKFQIEETKEVPPAFSETNDSGSWKIYSCVGKWILDAEEIQRKFVAKVDYRKVFSLTFNADGVTVVPHDELVTVKGSQFGDIAGAQREFHVPEEHLADLEIHYKSHIWRFSKSLTPILSEEDRKKPAFLMRDREGQTFKQALGGAAAAILLLLLISPFMTKDKDEEDKEKKFTKIVLKKRERAPLPTEPTKKEPEKVAEKPKDVQETPPAPPVDKIAKAQTTKPVKAPTVNKRTKKTQESPIQAAVKPKPLKKKEARNKIRSRNRLIIASKQGPKKLPAPPKKTAKPKPRVNQAVTRAQNLKKSLAKLMRGGSKSLLAGSKSLNNAGRNRSKSTGIYSTDSDADGASAPKVDIYSAQNANVGLSTGGGAKSKGQKSASYEYGGDLGTQDVGGKGGAFLSVAIDEGRPTMAEEGLTKEEVYRVINRHLSEVRYCYEKAILKKPNVEGKMVVDFTIGGTGKVKKSAVKTSSVGDSGLDNCVLTRLAKWKFPQPRGKIDVGVLYPFIFRRL